MASAPAGNPEARRTALVTGAARGIGAAIARRLEADGFALQTLDREPGCTHQVELPDGELPDLSGIDVCVSNAAITTTIAPAHRMSREQWDGDIAVNLTGAFRVVGACLAGMRERGYGRIVCVSSGAARTGLPGQVAYAASKAGLGGMVRTVAAENAARGITANAVLPGMVATETVRSMPAELLDQVVGWMPTGRLAEPEEIAALVAWLCAEEAGYVTGQEIVTDGALSLNTRSLTVGSQGR